MEKERTCRCCGFHGVELLFKKLGKLKSDPSVCRRGNTCRKCDARRAREKYASDSAENRARQRRRRTENPERFRRKDRERYWKDPETARKRGRERARTDAGRQQNRLAVAEYQRRHPERIAARQAVSAALKTGVLSKPETCEVAGCTCSQNLAAHHVSYARHRRLDVVWVCAEHHEFLHHRGRLSLKEKANRRKFAFAPPETFRPYPESAIAG